MNYWNKRLFDSIQHQYDLNANKLNKELQKMYLREYKSVRDKLLSLYARLQGENITPADLYKYNQYYEMINVLNNDLKTLGNNEIRVIQPALEKQYNDVGNIIYKAYNFSPMSHMKEASEVLLKVWCSDGKLWSDRIWENQTQLIDSVRKGLIDCIVQGKSSKELASNIKDKFGSSFYQAQRLCRTEMAHIQNESAKDRYTEMGIEKVEWIAASDGNICDDCEELNHQIFDIDSIPDIQHPNCRCTFVPISQK